MARVKHTPASRKSGKKKAPRASTSTQPSLSSSQSTQGRKKMRNRQGTVALREIRHLQRSCELLIPAAPFIRCVKQITNQFSSEVSRWTPEAVVALQEISGRYSVLAEQRGPGLLWNSKSRAVFNSNHNLRLIIMQRSCVINWFMFFHLKKDIELARRLGGIGRPW
ncbi:hypothetical protein JHK82_045879 [Glycine max]|uniref:Core Histone H2A/H2B/H3 domain-containing protein n=1 Tax=Glycine max TaxID=3847 RepID=A0A0R0FTE6_SOYBN|nr:hypothetical protein JHK85_044798 [Glycine max]KAG5100827.1 hypothetical protein JHK82_045879 [Glycine max]